MKPLLVKNSLTHSTSLVNKPSKNLTERQKRIVLTVALATFFILAIPAIIVYIVFKAKAIRNCKPILQLEAKKVTAVTSSAFKQAVAITKNEGETSKNSTLTQCSKEQIQEFDQKVSPTQPTVELCQTSEKEILDNAFTDLAKEQVDPIESIQPETVESAQIIEQEKIFKELKTICKKIEAEIQVLDTDNKRIVEKVLQDIQNACETDHTFTDGEVKEKTQLMKERLSNAIKIAGVNRELKKKGLVVSPLEFEIPLLNLLAYKINEAYHNKEFIYEVLSQTVLQSIDKETISCLRDITDFFIKIGLKVRLAQINITEPNKIEKFHTSLQCLNSYIGKILLSELSFPEDCCADKFPLTVKRLQKSHKVIQKRQVTRNLAKFLRKNKFQDLFENSSVDKNQMATFFEKPDLSKLASELTLTSKLLSNLKDEKVEKFAQDHIMLIKEHLSFMKDFGPYLSYEYVQGGVDRNEILGTGVCYTVVDQLIENSINAPHKGPLELMPTINQRTRFNQIRYEFGGKTSHFIRKVEFGVVLSKNFRMELTEKLIDCKNNFKSSSGWVDICIAFGKKGVLDELRQVNSTDEISVEKLKQQINQNGHAIAFRIDTDNKRMALFDPNVGYFSFDNVQDGEIKLAECLDRLLSLFYKDFVALVAQSLRPKSTNKKDYGTL